MYIKELLEVSLLREKEVYVKALAEDCKLIYKQTYTSPEEYGPTMVEAFIPILDIEEYYDIDISIDECEEYAKKYLTDIKFDLNWRVIEDDY
jgi:hypothetical protein